MMLMGTNVILWSFGIMVLFVLLTMLESRFLKRLGFDVLAHLQSAWKEGKTKKFFFETFGIVTFVLFQSYALVYLCSRVSNYVPALTPNEHLELLKIVSWPFVTVVGILAVRPYLALLLSGSKVKLSLFGQAIETTLPELGRIIQEQTGGTLSTEEFQYLDDLYEHGLKEYPLKLMTDGKYENSMTKAEHDLLRPLRNYGFIMTIPRHATLTKATSIQLTSLGRLYMHTRKR